MSRKAARKRLGVTEPQMTALIRSGLLGYLSHTLMVSDQAILSYQKFGTQWWVDGRWGPETRIMGADVYDNLPPVENIGPQPPATWTRMMIAPADHRIHGGEPENDTGWIFHFYLVVNYFYLPNLTELALLRTPPLKLSEPMRVAGADLPTTLYPHPYGNVGFLVVEGWDRPVLHPQTAAGTHPPLRQG